jgi:hypothetical protein
METIQIKLAALWTCLMLTYLLGDVLRIFSGDFKPGEIMGQRMSQGLWLGIAAVMLIPILMVSIAAFESTCSPLGAYRRRRSVLSLQCRRLTNLSIVI